MCNEFGGFLARARVGAQSGLGPGPGWGPHGPLWAHMGPILFRKSLILMKNHKTINKHIKGVKSEKIKVKHGFAIRTCLRKFA